MYGMADDLRDLVGAAFDQARTSGKTEWWVMAVPVLKNRLLQLTEREFDEAAYGVNSFTELVASDELAPIVQLDDSHRPARVILRSATSQEPVPQKAASPHLTVRPDLWKAVIDYSSGTSWCWDDTTGAVAADAGQPLPTVTASEMDAWRMEFAAQHQGDTVRDAVDVWLSKGLGAGALPARLRGDWFSYLKNQVIERLQAWFESHSMESPADLTYEQAQRPAKPEMDLRSYVQRVINQMSSDELRLLQLPATATARLGDSKR